MNILAKRSFPEFYQSYAPKLLEFYSAWLDWTDLKGNSQYIINHLSTEQDIDESIDAYKTHLKSKYLNDFPEKMVIDLKLLLKNVLYLYRAKSSKKAYDFLFRVLFDSPAKLWYPRENILKTSDGRWYIPCYISFEPVVNSDGESLFPQYDDEILTDAFGNTINNAYILDNYHYFRITGDISKSISYIEQPTNFAGTVKTRDENGEIILKDLDELTESNYQYGQSAISITSSTGWFYPGETVTITNVDTGEELPYHPVVQWYVETAGHYTSNKGFLSDINCLQDNYYYQNYSYVIQSYVGIRYWRDIVKKLLHPAGLGFFGEVLLSGALEDGDGIYYYKDIDDRPKDTFGDNEDMQQYLEEHPEYKDSFNPKDQCEPYIDYIRRFYVFFKHILEYSNNVLDYCFDSQGNHIYVEDSEEYIRQHPDAVNWADETKNKARCSDTSMSYSINLMDYVYDENGKILTDKNNNPITNLSEDGLYHSPRLLKRNKLAQTRSIITDIWLFEDYLTKLYPDLKETDLIPYKNVNSVLLFRDLGTLIDPAIIDWAYVGFTEDIDEPFDYNGIRIAKYKTKDIYGVTLNPEYDAIIDGKIDSNEYQFNEDSFIPNNYLVFITSKEDTNTSRVGTLTINNDYLNYCYSVEVSSINENNQFTLNEITYQINFDEDDNPINIVFNDINIPIVKNKFIIDEIDYKIDTKLDKVLKLIYDEETYTTFIDKIVKDTLLKDMAKKYNKDGNFTENNDNDNDTRTTITNWGTLVTDDFIFVFADSNRIFNQYSLVKIPDEYVTVDEENKKYIFNKNAYLDENIRIYNYSDRDFSYKIWIERNNYDITVKLTFSENRIPKRLPSNKYADKDSYYYWTEYWKQYIKNQNLEPISYSIEEQNGKLILTYNFKTPVDKQVSQFEISFQEYIDDNRFMLFTNGLFTPKHNISDGKYTKITIDTVENKNIKYEAENNLLADMSLDTLVSISETNTELFGEFTLPDLMMLVTKSEQLKNTDLRSLVKLITSTEISTQTSYAELYVLSQIEAPTPRILRYPYYPNKQSFISRAYAEEYGLDAEKIKDINNPKLFKETELYLFTYDNLRLMPFVPHAINIKKHSVAEIAPDKERLKPKTYSHISWSSVFNKEIRITYHNVIKKTNPAQNHSELLDMVLDRFNYDEYNIFNTGTVQEFTNNYDIIATTNRNSTLVFDENGYKVGSNNINWARKFIDDTSGRTLYSVPLNSTKVIEKYTTESSNVTIGTIGETYTNYYIITSDKEHYKYKTAFIFIDGVKVLDCDILYDNENYKYGIDTKYFIPNGLEKTIEIYNFGNDFLLPLGSKMGYIAFNQKELQ